MFINTWWIHHCAGNLDPKNDPYSEDFESPFYEEYIKPWQIILICLSMCLHTTWYGFAVFYMMRFFIKFKNWIVYLFVPSFILLLLFYVMMNIITIRKILK